MAPLSIPRVPPQAAGAFRPSWTRLQAVLLTAPGGGCVRNSGEPACAGFTLRQTPDRYPPGGGCFEGGCAKVIFISIPFLLDFLADSILYYPQCRSSIDFVWKILDIYEENVTAGAAVL